MYATDRTDFNALLESCAQVFGPKELTNNLRTTYWESLKDLPLQQIRERAALHLRVGKFFPKPTELRPKEERKESSRSVAMDAQFRDGEQRAIANLEQLRRETSDAWRNDVWLRKLDRIIATASADSPIYAQGLVEARRLRPLVRGY